MKLNKTCLVSIATSETCVRSFEKQSDNAIQSVRRKPQIKDISKAWGQKAKCALLTSIAMLLCIQLLKLFVGY